MSRLLGRHARAPIGLQLVALLLVSLFAAQAITFIVLAVLPPPRPQIYRGFEVVAALRGTNVEPRLGRPLVRTVVKTLPSDLAKAFTPPHVRRALATELGVPDAEVRIVTHDDAWPWRRSRHGFHTRFDGPPPPGDHGPGVGLGDHGPGPGPEGRPFEGDGPRLLQAGPGPDGRMLMVGGGPGRWSPADMPIVGEVAAALRQPNGTWVVVRSRPEPFPTEWQKRTLLWLAAGFLVLAPPGLLFARRITAPLKKFAEAADHLGRDPRATPPLALSGPAEIGMAARAFNEMQARLRRYIDDRTAMVGAISHDLRTPLARIRFKMERAPAELRTSVLADIAQMEQMIGDVLAFIRDEGQPRQRERLDLLSLVECVADDAAMLGGDVEIAEAAPLTVDGDPVGLKRLFANLVDNAVKYGRGARISVVQEGENAVVSIADFGPGLAAEELEKVFQPFYRADASRNLDKGGVGLGLPIARATARAHGGDVELASGGRGAVAKVSLPLAI